MEQRFVNGSPMQLALRETRKALSSRLSRVGMGIAILLLAVSGPFGTFQQFNVGQRLAYWASVVIVTYLVGQFSATMLTALLQPRIAQRWPRLIVAALLAAVPVTLMLVVINSLAYGRFEPREVANLWLYATLVTVVMVTALASVSDLYAVRPAPDGPTVTPAAAETVSAVPPPILERVPLPQRGKLLALLVEDHYVDIVTDRGKTLVLMRLADAIREAVPVAGLQIHRSHWVAREAVTKVHRSDGRVTLELSNGLRLPVSRGYLPAVKEAGFVPG